MINTKENDFKILSQLYDGLHLEPLELERAFKLLKMFEVELKTRCK